MKPITHALAGFTGGLAILAMIALLSGCARKPKPAHVPLVRYHATIEDKRCRPHPDGVRWICDHVVLDPQEIDARNSR